MVQDIDATAQKCGGARNRAADAQAHCRVAPEMGERSDENSAS
jgi:hypothetical protein